MKIDMTDDDGTEGKTVVQEGEAGEELPERASRNEDGTIALTLRSPVTLTIRDAAGKTREQVYEELVFHPLFGADMRAISTAREDQRIDVLIARCLKISQATARALFDKLARKDAEDVVKVAGFL